MVQTLVLYEVVLYEVSEKDYVLKKCRSYPKQCINVHCIDSIIRYNKYYLIFRYLWMDLSVKMLLSKKGPQRLIGTPDKKIAVESEITGIVMKYVTLNSLFNIPVD